MIKIFFGPGYIKGVEEGLRSVNIMQSEDFFMKVMFAHFEHCRGRINLNEMDDLMLRYNVALAAKHECLYEAMFLIGQQCK